MISFRLNPGDRFRVVGTSYTFGIAIGNGKAVVITGNGGREGYIVEKVDIPRQIRPIENAFVEMSFPTRVALDAVAAVIAE